MLACRRAGGKALANRGKYGPASVNAGAPSDRDRGEEPNAIPVGEAPDCPG